jgi:PIN domain nuclease of toxin-antitoxin system
MIVLDTHAWIWWASRKSRLSRRARTAMDKADTLGICAISCWEIAMLVDYGRLELDRDVRMWIEHALALPKIELVPLTPDVAVGAYRLPEGFHGDPADRMIVATARLRSCSLITKDAGIRDWGHVQAIW